MEHNEINLIFLGEEIDDNLYKLLESIDYIEYPPRFEEILRMINEKLLSSFI